MTLIAGLGNIGKEYENTRHNVGFMLIDLILKDGGYSDVSSAKFQGELYKNGSLLLLKPSTYMNSSGKSLKAVNDFYKPNHIIVIHDDLDIGNHHIHLLVSFTFSLCHQILYFIVFF